MVMQDHYETRFNIFDHLNNRDRPLASVEMFPVENYTEMSAMFDAYEEYAQNNYREIWGLSIDEFLSRPRYVIEMMRDITTRVLKRKSAAIDEVKQEFDQKR